jgi:hypothetical protein
MIDPDIQRELQFELIESEKLIWTGRPNSGIVFRNNDLFLIPFGLIWFGFVLIAAFSVASANVPGPAVLFFIPFFIAGLYVTVGRFFIDRKRRANTIYGITDNRVIIRSGIFSKSVNSLNIKSLPNISISEKSDGSGTIVLGQNDFMFSLMTGMMSQGRRQTPRLESITDVKNVYSLLLKLQRN